MAEIQKKTINIWDGGIKTSGRSSDPIGMDGAQMVKDSISTKMQAS